MIFKCPYLFLLFLPAFSYCDTAPYSPLNLSNGGIPLLTNDEFSMAYQLNHSKRQIIGVYYCKPYFHFDYKAIHATYLRQSNHFLIGFDVQLNGNSNYSYKHFSFKNGLQLKQIQVNCSLAYNQIKVSNYDLTRQAEGCLAFLMKINKKTSSIICLKGLSSGSKTTWNSQFNIKFTFQKSSELNIYLDKGSLLNEGVTAAFCHELKDASKIMFGLNYKCSKLGIGYTKQYKNIHLQLGISYHQFLGSGISNGMVYEI